MRNTCGVGWYFNIRQGWCFQTVFSFPGYKLGVVVKPTERWETVSLRWCCWFPYWWSLVCAALCCLPLKSFFFATLASTLEVAVPWYKISQMSSNVNDYFNPSFLSNMLTWAAKVMVWTLQGDWICHNESALRDYYIPIWRVILLSCKAL